MSASQVLEAWASAQPIEVPAADRRKQKPFARKIADGHTREQVMAAFVGMGKLFPALPPEERAVGPVRPGPGSSPRRWPRQGITRNCKSKRFDEEFVGP